MPSQVQVTSKFEKDVKRLKRKYPAVKGEISKLITQLEDDERPGDKISGVGHDVYKVRLANPSAKRGKSGGFRAIYYLQLVDSVMLLTIYSKTEQVNISPEEIRAILQEFLPSDDTDEGSNE